MCLMGKEFIEVTDDSALRYRAGQTVPHCSVVLSSSPSLVISLTGSLEECKGISLDGIMDRSCSLEKNFFEKVLVLFLASFFQRAHSVYH